MPSPGQPLVAEQLANLLALQINVEPVLVPDATAGDVWAVRFTISHPSGMFFAQTMSPENARGLGKTLKDCALECATKIVPVRPKVSLS